MPSCAELSSGENENVSDVNWLDSNLDLTYRRDSNIKIDCPTLSFEPKSIVHQAGLRKKNVQIIFLERNTLFSFHGIPYYSMILSEL